MIKHQIVTQSGIINSYIVKYFKKRNQKNIYPLGVEKEGQVVGVGGGGGGGGVDGVEVGGGGFLGGAGRLPPLLSCKKAPSTNSGTLHTARSPWANCSGRRSFLRGPAPAPRRALRTVPPVVCLGFGFDKCSPFGLNRICRIQNPDIPRAGRVGAHGGVAGRGRAGLFANRTVRLGNNPSSHSPKHRRHVA